MQDTVEEDEDEKNMETNLQEFTTKMGKQPEQIISYVKNKHKAIKHTTGCHV